MLTFVKQIIVLNLKKLQKYKTHEKHETIAPMHPLTSSHVLFHSQVSQFPSCQVCSCQKPLQEEERYPDGGKIKSVEDVLWIIILNELLK